MCIRDRCYVYNRKLFRQAGVPYPKAGWTWDDFVRTARLLTDPRRGTFGTSWPGTGDEDTVWRLWPLVWDLGGEVIAPDGHSIGFKDVGERALAPWRGSPPTRASTSTPSRAASRCTRSSSAAGWG